jgi:hypothetical protein
MPMYQNPKSVTLVFFLLYVKNICAMFVSFYTLFASSLIASDSPIMAVYNGNVTLSDSVTLGQMRRRCQMGKTKNQVQGGETHDV